MLKNDTIEHCPHCGSKDINTKPIKNFRIFIECKKCIFRGVIFLDWFEVNK